MADVVAEFRALAASAYAGVVFVGREGENPFDKATFVPRRMFLAFVRAKLGVAGVVEAKVAGPGVVMRSLTDADLAQLKGLWSKRAEKVIARDVMSLSDCLRVFKTAFERSAR